MFSPRSRMMGKVILASLMLATLTGAAFAQAPASTPPDSAASTQAAPAATPPPAATPAPADRVAAIKASLVKDRAALKEYQWVETTTMSLKGEVKSTKQNTCSYGADGKLVKVLVGDQPEAKNKKGIRGKVIENKKEEISDYMTKAAAAIKTYIPPDPVKLQAAKDAGNASFSMLEPGKRARIDFKNYNIPGDLLGIEFDLVTNKLLGFQVTTMVEGGKEPVTFQAQYGMLTDGTGYPMKTTLDATEMSVTIVVENGGYKKQATN